MNADRDSAPIIDHCDTIAGIDRPLEWCHTDPPTPRQYCYRQPPKPDDANLDWRYFQYTYPVFYEQEQALLDTRICFSSYFFIF